QEEIPFSDYFKEWYELYKTDITKNTLRHYKYSLNIIREYFPLTLLQQIDRRSYQKFLNEFGSTKSKETVDKVHSHIKACVRDALDEDIIFKDFTRNTVVTSKMPEKSTSEKHLNYHDSIVLLNNVYNKLDDGLGYYAILLALTSGLRYAEIVGLTLSDFDFINNTISINKTWGHINGMHDGFGPTKNKSSERIVKMDKKTMNEFNKMLKCSTDNVHEILYYSSSSKYKVISNTNTNKLLRKLLNQLNLTPITFHGLRHTHASILIYKREVTINYISERLGHSDIETTLKKYTHLLKELKVEDELRTTNVFDEMYTK